MLKQTVNFLIETPMTKNEFINLSVKLYDKGIYIVPVIPNKVSFFSIDKDDLLEKFGLTKYSPCHVVDKLMEIFTDLNIEIDETDISMNLA